MPTLRLYHDRLAIKVDQSVLGCMWVMWIESAAITDSALT
jgi:hypothetical protein